VVAITGVLILTVPLSAFTLGETGPDTYPKSLPAIANYQKMVAAFPAEGYTFVVAVRANGADSPVVVAGLEKLAKHADHDPLFAPRNAMTIRTSADHTVSTAQLSVPYGINDPRAQESLQLLRNQLVPAAVNGVARAEFGVTGEVARAVDYVHHQESQTPWVVGFALLATLVMMFAAFRSVPIAIAGVLLNMLSYAATLGALVLVFQNHWAEGILGFDSAGFISDRVPLILFVILFGLSMDYQVFVVSRIREAVRRGVPTRQAVYDGVTTSAGVVTIAAVIMMSVFASFLFVGLTEMKEIAFGLGLSVILDAVVVRVMILPALMTIMGDRIWWPSLRPSAATFAAKNVNDPAELPVHGQPVANSRS
jgi:RND superfamily putative drug exporter